MIHLEECIAVLLCAGLSRRFGTGNKLLAPVAGKPLVAHAAELCSRAPFAGRIAVVPPSAPALAALLVDCSFELVVNPRPEAGKNSSLRLGLAQAVERRAPGALVLLGDMPHIDLTLLLALSAAADDDTAAICSAEGHSSPPTLIPARAMQKAINAVDQPVRASLGRLVEVATSASTLVDYDSPKQFCATDESGGHCQSNDTT